MAKRKTNKSKTTTNAKGRTWTASYSVTRLYSREQIAAALLQNLRALEADPARFVIALRHRMTTSPEEYSERIATGLCADMDEALRQQMEVSVTVSGSV